MSHRRQLGKATVSELLLWDVVLVVLVGGLAYVDGHLEAEAAKAPKKETGAQTNGSKVTPTPTPRPSPTVRRTEPSEDKDERNAKKKLKALRAKADAKLKAGKIDEALEVFKSAPARLRLTRAWQEGYPAERKRILSGARERDLFVCLRAEVQAAADQGKPREVERLLEAVPASQRSELSDEVEWAQKHVVEGGNGGLQIRGFSPDRVKVDGTRCVIDCAVGRAAGQRLRGDVDALTRLGEDLLGSNLSGKLEVRVNKPEDAAEPGSETVLVVYQRYDERPDQAGPLDERVRLMAARWTVDRLVTAKSGWTREAMVRLLISAKPTPNKRPLLTPVGVSLRRLFLQDAPDGKGDALLALAQRGDDGDPAGARSWALLLYAYFAPDALVDLRKKIDRTLRAGDTTLLLSWLTPTRAVGIEEAWVAYLEAS